jgi:hypothetical protein
MALGKGLSQVLKRLGPKKVKEMDESAKRGMFGQPEKATKEKGGKMTKKEQEDMQKSLREEEAKKKKKAGMTNAEKKAAQEELNAPAKKGRSLEEVEKDYTPAERRELEKKLKSIGRSAMAKGGMPKKYSKGGMGTAKCGASNPPAGGASRKK